MRVSTFNKLCDDLNKDAGDIGRMLREIDRNLELCRLLLDLAQPSFPGRIELRWWLRGRRPELGSYLKPYFTKLLSVPRRSWPAAQVPKWARKGGAKKPTRIWRPSLIDSKHLTKRIRRNRGFFYCLPIIEDTLILATDLLRAREEVVKAILTLSTTKRRFYSKHAAAISTSRPHLHHLRKIVEPYLRSWPGSSAKAPRQIIDPNLLKREGAVLTRHGPIKIEAFFRAGISPLLLNAHDIFDVEEDVKLNPDPTREFPELDPIEVPRAFGPSANQKLVVDEENQLGKTKEQESAIRRIPTLKFID